MEDRSHTSDAGAPTFNEILRDLCNRMELDHAALGVYLPDSDRLHAYATYPSEFNQHYEREGLQAIDPTLDCARNSVVPCDLSRMKDHPGFVPIFVDCARFGLPSNGMSFPLHAPDGGWGVFNVLKNCTDSEWARLISRKAPSLHYFGLHLFDSARTSLRGGTQPIFNVLPARLDDRELDMLKGVSQGLSISQIAYNLGISKRAAEHYLRGAVMKIQAVSPEHAAARAQGLGLF